MDNISALFFSLLCSSSYDIIKSTILAYNPNETVADKVSIAYQKALAQWTPYRDTEKPYDATIEEKFLLLKAIVSNKDGINEVDENILELLEFFKSELMSCNIAYNALHEAHWEIEHSDIAEIKERLNDLSNALNPKTVELKFNFDVYIKDKINLNKHHILRKLQKALFAEETQIETDLVSLLKTEKRIVILASAAIGKTEEVKQTAYLLANERKKYPIVVLLNNYTGEDIETCLPEGWNSISPKEIVIFFDGFDEIIAKDVDTFKRKLSKFTKSNEDIKIVVTTRTNFYDLAVNGNAETLSEFTPYHLLPLTTADVEDYVSKNFQIDGRDFIRKIYDKDFEDIVINPFFLQTLILNYKNNNNEFSGNRIEIFQNFIQERISLDKKHFNGSFDLNSKGNYILELLREIAFSMEMLGTRYITSNDLSNIIKMDSFDFVKHCPFNKESETENWRFEHNNFQEILCAEYLANFSCDEIISFISYVNYPKIKSSWVNTVTFLISILKEDNNIFKPLLDWIIQHDHEILVKVERERLSSDLRNTIFKQIFNYYKEKNIWISSNKFTYRELAFFAQTNETIDFIMNEVQNENNARRVRLNGLYLLEEFSIDNYPNKEKIKLELISLFKKQRSDDTYLSNIISVFKNWEFYDKETIDALLVIVDKNKSSIILPLINESYLFDDYVDYYLQNILEKDNSVNNENIFATERHSTAFAGIIRFKTYTALSKLIDFTIEERNEIDYDYDYNKTYNIIIENCISCFWANPSIYENLYKLLEHQCFYYHNDKITSTLSFFIKTETRLKAFKSALIINTETDREWKNDYLICNLANEQCLELLIESYNSKKISKDRLTAIFNCLYSVNNELSRILFDKIQQETDVPIEIPVYIDRTAIRIQRKQESFDLLFDVNKFKYECLRIFQNKDLITNKELQECRMNDNKKDGNNFYSTAFRKLQNFLNDDNSISKQEVTNWFDTNPNVSNYIISQIYDSLKNDKDELIISKAQIEHIRNWFENIISTIDFLNAIKRNNDTTFTLNWHAIFSSFFLKKFNFECCDDTLLDMLSFTFSDSYLSFDYICNKLPEEKIKDRVILNIISKRLQNETVYENHVEYAFKNQLQDAYSTIFNDLCENKYDSHHKRHIVDLFFKNNLDSTLIKTMFDNFDIKTRLAIIKYLIDKEDYQFSVVKLLELHIIDLEEENEKQVNNLLISCSNIYGLEYSINWINKYKKSPFSQHGQRLVYYKEINSLPFFIQLIELGHHDNISIGNELDRMLPLILDGVEYLAVQSKENYNIVCQELSEFIQKNKDKLKEVEFLNSSIERIKERYFRNYTEQVSIREIKKTLAKNRI